MRPNKDPHVAERERQWREVTLQRLRSERIPGKTERLSVQEGGPSPLPAWVYHGMPCALEISLQAQNLHVHMLRLI
jgi:hypothetical protein